MLSRACCLLALLSLAVHPAAADEAFPYTAHAAREGVTYHSGPGADYYPAGHLGEDEAVEVYRHDADGWCAIRPPEGSFSWLDEAHLQPLGDGLAEVLGDDAVTRVGSLLSDSRDVRQVRLDAAEQVEIIDRVTEGVGPDARRWFKIAPPAGEFRWVRRDDLRVESSADESLPEEKRRNLLISDELAEDVQELPVSAAEHAAEAETTDESSDDANSGPPAPAPSGWKADRRGPRQKSTTSTIPEPPVSQDVTEELDSIELAISRIVAGEPTAWAFDRWRERAAAVKERATTTADRSRASSLLRRMKRFDDIHQRAVSLGGDEASQGDASQVAEESTTDPPPAGAATAEAATPESSQERAIVAEIKPRVAGPSEAALSEIGKPAAPGAIESDPFAQPTNPTTTPADDRFDGVGRLARVVSKKAGVPQYALLDEQGAVRHYVTPAPGVNLRRYLGHQVGITGMRGVIPELNAGHVTAKRVTAMDGGRLLR